MSCNQTYTSNCSKTKNPLFHTHSTSTHLQGFRTKNSKGVEPKILEGAPHVIPNDNMNNISKVHKLHIHGARNFNNAKVTGLITQEFLYNSINHLYNSDSKKGNN